ncbi:MAG: hypothetical protein V1861_04100 [Candidatus Micrarchaeota archaeon]
MAQTQRPTEARLSETERIFMDKLVHRGYTDVQAREFMDIVQRLRSGQNVVLTSRQSEWVNDINTINASWSRISPSTRRLSQLQPGQVSEMFSGLMLAGPSRPGPTMVAEVQTPAPVRTFVYDVTIDGSHYRVQTNAALVSGGLTTVQGSRAGQLSRMLSASPNPIIAITTPEGATVSGRTIQNTPEFAQFAEGYASAYNAMLRNPNDQRIAISEVRRRRGS